MTSFNYDDKFSLKLRYRERSLQWEGTMDMKVNYNDIRWSGRTA